MMGVSVKSCAPQREELLRQRTSALLRELCSGELICEGPVGPVASRLELLRQLPSYRYVDCCWMNDAFASPHTGSFKF